MRGDRKGARRKEIWGPGDGSVAREESLAKNRVQRIWAESGSCVDLPSLKLYKIK